MSRDVVTPERPARRELLEGSLSHPMRKRSIVSHRFAAPEPSSIGDDPPKVDIRAEIMSEIARQASEAWGGGRAIAAHDLMTMDISANRLHEQIA
jgi:hypothetical protein